ncbi:MAG: hypothetical protein E6Q90_11975 [Actinobacteria bacterium]|nr:MAG: hypothetical protein E6Q90_11975 [Actinomycetota bacterium]
MRRTITVVLALALAGIVAPAAAASPSTRVDYWLDRDPGPWTGGMVVIRRGAKFWAYGKFFEGRVCLAGRRSGNSVPMKGTFEQYERERVRVSWPLRNGMPKVRYTLGTAGEWRRVSRTSFVTGTTTGDRLIRTARVNTPARWRDSCGWSQSAVSSARQKWVYMIREQGCFASGCFGSVVTLGVRGRSVRYTMVSSQANTVYSIGPMRREGRVIRGWSGSECYRSKGPLAVRGSGSKTRFPGYTIVSGEQAEAFAQGLSSIGPFNAADPPGVTTAAWHRTYERICR